MEGQTEAADVLVETDPEAEDDVLAAWRDYLALDSSSDWAREARARLGR